MPMQCAMVTHISVNHNRKRYCYKKIFRCKKIFASPICYNQYRSLSISQKSVINIDKDGCQLRRRSAMGRRSSVIAKRVEEEYQKEKMRSDQMQQQQMLDQNQKDEESTVRKSKRISKDKVSKEG